MVAGRSRRSARGGCVRGRMGNRVMRARFITSVMTFSATLPQMTLEQRVGQMLMLRLPGGFENLRGTTMRETERYILEAGVGGFVVGPGSPADLAMKLNELQSRSRIPLLFAADLEWSAPVSVDGSTTTPALPEYGGPVFPVNMGIAPTR